mgnify:CR=1 FL=1
MDKRTLDIWRVVATRDPTGSLTTVATRVLQSVRGIVVPAASLVKHLGEGLAAQYDIAVLFECDDNNTGLWDILRESPHELWMLFTDPRLFLYQRAAHIESVQPSALNVQGADFSLITMAQHLSPQDAVIVDTINMTIRSK